MLEQQPLEESKPKINNLPFVKGEKMKIVVWFLVMVAILIFPTILLRYWSTGCAKEIKFYGSGISFGCTGNLLYSISLWAFIALVGITVLFAVFSFIKKTPNQFLTILYLIVAGITILPALIMLGGNISFFN